MKKYLSLGLILFCFLTASFFFQGPHLVIPFHVRLVSSNNVIRNLAYRHLSKMDGKATMALVPQIISHLKDNNPKIRRYALYALRRIHSQDEATIGAMLLALKDDSTPVRKEAVIGLISIGNKAVDQLIPLIHTLPDPIQEKCLREICWLGDSVVPLAQEHLSDEDVGSKLNSTKILGELKSLSIPALPKLIQLLRSPNKQLRYQTALAINKIDPKEIRTLNVLKDIINEDGYTELKISALECLTVMGEKARPLIPTLNKALISLPDGYGEGPYLKPLCAQTLQHVDPRKTDPDSLRGDIKQNNSNTRYRAFWFLGEMDSAPRALLNDVVACYLKESEETVSGRALKALAKLDFASATRFHDVLIPRLFSQLQTSLKTKNIEQYTQFIAENMAQLGDKIIPFALNRNLTGQLSTAAVLTLFSCMEVDDLAKLKPALHAPNKKERQLAAVALAEKGQWDNAVAKNLQDATQSEDSELRVRVGKLLEVRSK